MRAVDGVDLTIEAGEFFTLLGPSGSGKTTCLRMIGGFTLPTAGRVLIGGAGRDAAPPYARAGEHRVPGLRAVPAHEHPRQRGLRADGAQGGQGRARSGAPTSCWRWCELAGVGDRRPAQLSGGQRQRVALARALINQPQVLLLDEPLGALDLKLREQMQSELKALQRRLGITFLFITHDQHEALSMSDRIGVFNQGRLEQVGTPQRGVRRAGDALRRACSSARPTCSTARRRGGSPARPARCCGPSASASARPPAHGASGTVREVQYFGAFTRIKVEAAGALLQADLPRGAGAARPAAGETVHLHWDARAVHALGSGGVTRWARD